MPSAPAAFDQASMTNTSLTAVTRMASTPLALISCCLLHVAGQVIAVAGRGESAGNGHEDHLAALEEIVRGLGHRPVRRHDAEGDLGQAFSDLDCHRLLSKREEL